LIKSRLPVATLIIIAANILAAFAIIFDPTIVARFGFEPANPSVLTAITSLFLHQNVLHLLGNMVFLAAIGPAVEASAGSARFVTVYLLGGFAGVATHWAFSNRILATPPLIGASGCISALIAYYCLRYYHLRVTVAPKLSVSVVTMIGIWLLLQIGAAFVSIGSVQAGTAYWAHLGGFLMGLLLSLTFSAPRDAQRQIASETITRMDERGPAAKLAAAEHALKLHPEDLGALLNKADAHAMLSDVDHEADTLIRMLDLSPELAQKELLARLDKINRLERLASLRRTMLAEKFKASEPDLSRLLLLSVIRVMSDKQRPDALLALAVLDHDVFPENCQTWLRDLFANYPLHPACDVARTRGWAP